MNPNDEQVNLVTVAISLGKIEQKLENMAGLDERLRRVETTLTKLEAQQRPKAPWYAVVGGVVGITSAIGGLVALFVILTQISNALEGRI